MLVAHTAPPQPADTGDFTYRVLQPDRALGKIPDFFTISLMNLCPLKRRILQEADVLLIQMLGDPDLLPVIEDRRRAGKATVFEVSDNFFEFQETNPARYFYDNPENQACLLTLISRCDAIQTPTQELATHFSEFNQQCRFFPNQIEEVPPMPARSEQPIVIGWAGSAGHYEDVKEIAPALTRWMSERPETHLAIMGSREIFNLFEVLPDERKTCRPPGSLYDYFQFLESLHIGIAPLRPDPFNLCRSDVKFIEYASRGVVPVCSRLETYTRTVAEGETGFLFGSPEGLVSVLEMLVQNPTRRTAVAGNARRYIQQHRLERSHAAARAEFYKSLAKTPSANPDSFFTWLKTLQGAKTSPDSNHIYLDLSDGEKSLYNGMVEQFHISDLQKAAKSYKAAARLLPDFYLPLYYGANALKTSDPSVALKLCSKAQMIGGGSPAVSMLLSELLAAQGDVERAVRELERSVKEFPFYPALWLRLAVNLLQTGKVDEAEAVLTEALKVNAWNFPAAAMHIDLFLRNEKPEEAGMIYRRHFAAYKNIPPAMLLIGSVLMAHKMAAEAWECFTEALRRHSTSARTIDSLLQLSGGCHRDGETELAAAILESALEIVSDHPEFLYRLARLKERLGDKASAETLWKKIISLPSAEKYHKLAYKRRLED
ncbi:MAG: tetratricopeptide repeat protein [bacterium]